MFVQMAQHQSVLVANSPAYMRVYMQVDIPLYITIKFTIYVIIMKGDIIQKHCTILSVISFDYGSFTSNLLGLNYGMQSFFRKHTSQCSMYIKIVVEIYSAYTVLLSSYKLRTKLLTTSTRNGHGQSGPLSVVKVCTSMLCAKIGYR